MADKKATDEEIISAYRQYQSTKEVSQLLGMAPRTLQVRRKRIEAARGIVLPMSDTRPAYARGRVDSERAVFSLSVSDGEVLIASDLHIWPGPLTTMQRAFLRFVKERNPQAVILNGDVFDGARVSRHPSIGWEKKPTVRQELEAVRDYLGDITVGSGDAKRIWPAGNHDLRFESRIAAMLPELEGVEGVALKDHFQDWAPCWRCDINDDVVVRHRELGGEHADFRNVQTQGKTIVTGHDHRTGVVHWVGYNGIHWGVRCGFMAESPLDPQFVHYLEGKVPNWVPAFVLLSFRNGRLLWPELCTWHDEGIVNFRGDLIHV